jgi:hypothetical protein
MSHTPLPWFFNGREVCTKDGKVIAITTIPEDGQAIADMSKDAHDYDGHGLMRRSTDETHEAMQSLERTLEGQTAEVGVQGGSDYWFRKYTAIQAHIKELDEAGRKMATDMTRDELIIELAKLRGRVDAAVWRANQ